MPSIVTAFEKTVQIHGAAVAARYRGPENTWDSITWSELDRQRLELAAGLIQLGLKPGETVNILASTSLQWMVADIAVTSVAAQSVPVYPAALPDECVFVLNDSGGRFIFVDDQEQLDKLQSRRADLLSIDKVIVFSSEFTTHSDVSEPPLDSEWAIGLNQLLGLGRAKLADCKDELERRRELLGSSSLLTTIYTSGTTGRPKGVVLTHGNLLGTAEACVQAELIQQDDVQLLFLPMAQVFAKLLQTIWFLLGHEMAIDANTHRLAQNLSDIRPTLMASVPRVYERIYSRFVTLGSLGAQGWMFRWAMERLDQYAHLKRTGQPISLALQAQLKVADRTVFSGVSKRLEAFLGGRMRCLISGSAPLSQKMSYFFERCGVSILEGYGLTETSAATTVNRLGAIKIGSVGTPLPGTEVKIAEDGEILVRSSGVMSGYLGRPNATKAALVDGGWLATGDVGAVDADGFLSITGRKKDLIVTAGGRNISPQKIENAIRSSTPLIGHVLVHGDRRKFLSALVTLEFEAAQQLGREHSVGPGHPAICRSLEAKQAVQAVIDRVNQGLAVHEQVRAFQILEQEFKVGDELTTTFKLRRAVCNDKYAPILNAFYEERFN